MWNYVWKRTGFVGRVVLNKRWVIPQRQFSRSSHQWSIRTVRNLQTRFSFPQSQSTRSFSRFSSSRVHSFFNQLKQQSQKYQKEQSKQTRSRWQTVNLTTTFCLGFGSLIAAGTSLDKVDLKVPSREEVNLQKEFASYKNAQYVHGQYDALIEEFLPKFSDTDREVVRNLNGILNGCNSLEYNFWQGKFVVEIGSGTGLLAFPIIDKIGIKKKSGGGYIGLDISPAFVHYLDREFERRGVLKTRAIVGQNTAQSLCLPENLKEKIDVFIICDTYYHLDNSFQTVKEISKFLKPGGKVVVIESMSEEKTIGRDMRIAGFNLTHKIMEGKLGEQFANIYTKK